MSPGTAIALSTDLGVASAMAKEADVGGSSGQRKKGLAVSRALTVCAAELGHGEHEAVVELACPPEPRPGGLAVPVLLLLTTQRRHFQRAHRGASYRSKRSSVGGSSGQRKKGLAVSRALTVCAAELGHGEHEAVVELACPPEPRPGGLAVPVLLLLTTQRRHFQRAHRGASYRSKRSSVGGVASMRSRSSGGRSSSRRRDDDDSGGCFYRGDTESSSSSSRSTPGQAATAAAG